METTNTPPRVLTRMPRRIPVNGTFELTVRCNLHCKMCMFRHDDRENPELMAKELTAAQWIDMARQAAEAGTMNLLITGGEPLLRPDFCEIWEGIYRQGFVTTLYTNATLVTPPVMETLRKYPPHKIGITIYGASPETYEKVCGNAGAFHKMIEGLKELSTLPSILEVRSTLIPDNVDDIHEIEKLACTVLEQDVKVIHTNNVIAPVRGGCANTAENRLSPEDTVNLVFRRTCDAINRYYVKKNQKTPDFSLRFAEDNSNELLKNKTKKPKLSLLGCDGGMDSYVISWDGLMLCCQLLGEFYTDALALGLLKAWELLPTVIHIPKDSECDHCELNNLCSTCYAVQYAETKTFDRCSFYHKRIAMVNQKYQKEDFHYETK